jgi:hypothetical protein
MLKKQERKRITHYAYTISIVMDHMDYYNMHTQYRFKEHIQ